MGARLPQQHAGRRWACPPRAQPRTECAGPGPRTYRNWAWGTLQSSQGAEAASIPWSAHPARTPQVPLLRVLDLHGWPNLASGWGALARLTRLERFVLRMTDPYKPPKATIPATDCEPLQASAAAAAFDAAWLPASLRHLSLELPPGAAVLNARRPEPPGPVAVEAVVQEWDYDPCTSPKTQLVTLQRQAEEGQ